MYICMCIVYTYKDICVDKFRMHMLMFWHVLALQYAAHYNGPSARPTWICPQPPKSRTISQVCAIRTNRFAFRFQNSQKELWTTPPHAWRHHIGCVAQLAGRLPAPRPASTHRRPNVSSGRSLVFWLVRTFARLVTGCYRCRSMYMCMYMYVRTIYTIGENVANSQK